MNQNLRCDIVLMLEYSHPQTGSHLLKRLNVYRRSRGLKRDIGYVEFLEEIAGMQSYGLVERTVRDVNAPRGFGHKSELLHQFELTDVGEKFQVASMRDLLVHLGHGL